MKHKISGTALLISIAAVGALILASSRSACLECIFPFESAKRGFFDVVVARVVGCFRGASANAENVRLRREVAELSVLRGDIERLENENANLRKALKYVSRSPASWLAAAVIANDGGAAGVHKVIRVDKGTADGVAKGAVVVLPEGLVGMVSQVSPHVAEIMLITDESLKVACEVETTTGTCARGVLSGGGNDLLVLRYLTTTEKLPPRSRVLTSGRGGVFPRGIEVGTFLNSRTGVDGFANEGEVLPQVDFSTLKDVFIRCGK